MPESARVDSRPVIKRWGTDCSLLVEPEWLGSRSACEVRDMAVAILARASRWAGSSGYEAAPTCDRGDLGASGERITVAATALPSVDRFPDGHCLWSGVGRGRPWLSPRVRDCGVG